MTRRSKIIYWIATIWLALGMLSTGIVQLLKMQGEADMMTHLGYPLYFLTIIGIWKILGVIVILIPKFPLLKEWAYAGFFFAMSGAIFSHLASGDEAKELFGPGLLIILTMISWYFRFATRSPGRTVRDAQSGTRSPGRVVRDAQYITHNRQKDLFS